MISTVPPDQLDFVWNQVEPQIEKAFSTGAGDRSSPAHLYQAVQDGLAHCLAVHQDGDVEAAIFISIKDFPTMRTLFVEVLAGRNLDSWLDDVEAVLKEYKKRLGADKIEASVRAGLAKRLTHWRQKSILLELDE